MLSMRRHPWSTAWALLVAGSLVAGACSSSPDGEDPGGPVAVVQDDADSDAGGVEEESSTEAPASTPEEEIEADDEESSDGAPPETDTSAQAEVVVAQATPLGEVVGATRPAGEEPSIEIVGSFERLCPAVIVETDVVLQSDPLVLNFPVQRHIILFASPEDATRFIDEIESTGGPGCTAERETEVSVGTTTVEELTAVEIEGRRGLQITAQVDVDLVDLEQDPPGAQVRRYLALEGNAVVVVVALAAYEDLVGLQVMEPLVVDGIELVGAIGS